MGWHALSIELDVSFFFQFFERKSFRTIQAEYDEISAPEIFKTLKEEEQTELRRLFESARKEMKLNPK